MKLLFKTKVLADIWLKEICCMPSGVFVWMGPQVIPSGDLFLEIVGDPDGATNVIGYADDVLLEMDIPHPYTNADIAFIQDYCAEIIATGDLIVGE